MKLSISIETPEAVHTSAHWPEGAPIPCVGDEVILSKIEGSWVFAVTKRTLSIGRDPRSGVPATTVLLTVDAPAPEGFHV